MFVPGHTMQGPWRSTSVSQEAEGVEENESKRFIVGSAGRNRWDRVSSLRIGQSWVFSVDSGVWELALIVWSLTRGEGNAAPGCESPIQEVVGAWVYTWKVYSFTKSRNWLFVGRSVCPESVRPSTCQSIRIILCKSMIHTQKAWLIHKGSTRRSGQNVHGPR